MQLKHIYTLYSYIFKKYNCNKMGNKQLRPSQLQPLSGFSDDQITYLKDKFDILCDQQKLLSISKISQAYKCSRQQASKILSYIDFQNKGQVDFYQFTCAAASLHQNDDDALEFLYDLFGNGDELDRAAFEIIYGTVFRYLKFLGKIQEDYEAEIGEKKFTQYDYSNNQKIGFDQFKSMLKNDYHCRMWMEELGFAQERPQERPEKPLNEQNGEFLLEQVKGDQAGSTPSWVKTIEYLAPDNKNDYKTGYDNPPTSNLDIQYVYGYRCYDTSNNLRYNSSNQIVYHTAGCGIALNKTKNTMKITTAHNDDITCLDLNYAKNLAVTGEMGRRPSLIIWDATTLETKAVFKSKLQKSISHVGISKSGRYVAATSMSDNHEIIVYDLSSSSMLAFGNGPRSVIHAIKFTHNDQQLVLACQKQVVFCKYLTGKVQTKKGVFGKAPLTANYCIGLLGDAVITGMGNGVIGYWKGNMCSRVYKEHTKPVTAMCERGEGAGIISGDSTGVIILWSANLSKERQIQLTKLVSSCNPRVISLCEGNGNILVGTRGGEIVEIQQKTGAASIAMEGHFDQELWGLAVLPNKHQFVTGGQDKLLIKWDSDKRKALLKKKLDYSIMSLDVNRNGIIAVGHMNGLVNFYDSNKLDYIKKIQTFKNPDKQVISVVKFSPNGSIIAVGYCPPISQVYLYNYDTSAKIGQCKGSPSRIYSIDFSRDGSSIMVNNSSYQILFYNTANGAQITTATSFKNEQFATMTNRFSWQTQGIWPPCSDGTDINSLDRSNSKKYLVTGDDFSKVKLFKYPVCHHKQIYNGYKGHSSHVTGVKWLYDDKFVISIGGLEKSVIQWHFDDLQEINYEFEEKKAKEEEVEEKGQGGEGEYQFEEEGKEEKGPAQEGEFNLEQDQGDQALAVKPFLGQVKASTPSSFKTLSMKNVQPEQNLKIKHAWGIRNQYINDAVRNQLRYSSDFSKCLFITAALGVQMDLKTKAQKFYQGHSEDLVSFAMTKDRKFCATGQMAQLNSKQPKSKIMDIHVWDCETKQRKVKLTGFHQRAVVVLEFSPSGKRLLSVGQDDKNSLAVYDWETGRLAWSAPVCGAKVNAGAWKNQEQYMTVGLKHVKMWRNGKGTMCKVPGKWDPMLSCVYWNDKFVSGGSQGALYLWSGSTAVVTKAHQSKIDCLKVDQNGTLYSGCAAGMINKWKYSGGKIALDQKILNMSQIDKLSPGILSLDFSNDNMLVCTNSSSIYQLPRNGKGNANVVMEAHYQVELWGEAWAPDSSKFVTGGDDRTVRIYDASNFEMKHIYKMKQRVRGLDWEKTKGQIIVVGDYKGKIYLFDSQLKLLDQAKTRFSKTKPRKQPYWIEDIKFSPNGEYVAFGAHGGSTHICIFEVKDGKFGKQTVIPNLISSAMLSVDWSQDSSNLAIVSQAYQLQFTSLNSKISASSVRQQKWATWSGKFGAYVQEIHQDVDYSNINAVDMSPGGQMIATGGDDQKIRLFKSPVIIPKQKNKQFIGHSSHVTKVRFSRNEQYLLSTGGNDRTIILWKVEGNQPEAQSQNQAQAQQAQTQLQANDQADEIQIPKTKQQLQDQSSKPKQSEATDDFALQEDEGDQFMAVKPWLGAIKEPTGQYYKSTGKAPKVELELEYAHGYRSKDCRNNLIYLDSSHIAYHTAGLGVIMNTQKTPKEQVFFNLHTDDIISIAWKQDKSSIFTGEMGAKPIIYQWNPQGNLIQKYKGAKKSVSAIGVNEKYLVAACMDDDHYLYLFEVDSGKMIGSEKGGREFITGIKWTDKENFTTIGIKHYKNWAVNGKTMKGKTGIFGKNCNILCCIAVKGSNAYIGASDGSLQVWSGNSCSKSIKIHQKSLNAICISDQVILTGSKDQTISILDLSTLKQLSKIDCKQLLLNSINCQVEALDVFQNLILIGTKGSEIYQLKSNRSISSTDETSQFRLNGHYMSGHYAPNHVTNEVWGLAVYNNKYYLTSGDDGTMRIWDIAKKEQVMWVSLDWDDKMKPRVKKVGEKFLPKSCQGNSICVAKTGEVVVGCKDGKIRVFDEKFRPRLVQNVSQGQISVVKLSPDESILGVGDHKGKITLLNWNQGAEKLKVKSSSIKHHSTIKNFDFSRDSNIIHSTCTSYQLLFWDVPTGKQITSGATSTRDEEWATWSLTLGWPVQGIFQQFMDGTDINAVDRSKKTYGEKGMRLLASSDDRGHVRLLEYPCLVKNSQSVKGNGHSSHVTNVQFSQDDQRIFSTGGEDQTVLQWIVHAD